MNPQMLIGINKIEVVEKNTNQTNGRWSDPNFLGDQFRNLFPAHGLNMLLGDLSYLASLNLYAAGHHQVASLAKSLCGLTWALAWACMTFHSAMRATLIVFPSLVKPPPWATSAIVVLAQLVLAGSSAYFFARSAMETHPVNVYQKAGTVVLLVESVWYSTVESVIFFAVQYKLISAVLELQSASSSTRQSRSRRRYVGTIVKPTRKLFWIYLNGALRATCYSVNIVMTFLSIGGYFPRYTASERSLHQATAFVMYGPSVAFLLIMTDAKRFRQALELTKPDPIPQNADPTRKVLIMNGSHRNRTHLKNNERTKAKKNNYGWNKMISTKNIHNLYICSKKTWNERRLSARTSQPGRRRWGSSGHQHQFRSDGSTGLKASRRILAEVPERRPLPQLSTPSSQTFTTQSRTPRVPVTRVRLVHLKVIVCVADKGRGISKGRLDVSVSGGECFGEPHRDVFWMFCFVAAGFAGIPG
ncbi:hypothetical protein BJ742DRAFT_894219 [Cladochytrium replicatum]|nr:hypothetical protein BJ742DRAFT_894219 [Cladochytrium replicatum]